MVIDPVLVPVVVGKKLILTEQEVPTATECTRLLR